MTTATAHAPGTFCWPELYTSDQNVAKKFYSTLFGWTVNDMPMGPDTFYTVFLRNGVAAAACYGKMPDMEKLGIPSHWMSYVSVASADEAAAKVKASGGTVMKEPFDIPNIGRMAACKDPGGAAFCVWEAKPQIGIGIMGETNTLTWTELLTRDAAACEKFYGAVFGWGGQAWPMEDGSNYHIFMRGEAMAAGMMTIKPEMGPLPSCWFPYMQVENVDAMVERAQELGGKMQVPSFDVKDVGRIGIISDPTGAHLGLMQPMKQA